MQSTATGTIDRRHFLGAMGIAMGAMAGAGVANATETTEAPADDAAPSAADSAADQLDWMAGYAELKERLASETAAAQAAALEGTPQAEVLAMVDKDFVDPLVSCRDFETGIVEAQAEGDLTLPDGRVVPQVYAQLRIHLNRVNSGFGNIPNADSYDLLMTLWSEQDAWFVNHMPVTGWVTAYDMSVKTGMTREECLETLEDLASRCLILRARRSGQAHFALIPHINGIWEFTELHAYLHNGGDPHDLDAEGNEAAFEAVREIVWPGANFGIRSDDDYSKDITFAALHSLPISKDVVEGGELAPYMDWTQVIESNEYITVSPCQCRLMWRAVGASAEEEHPFETCLSFGEMAAYFEENGIGRRISREEAYEVVENAIGHGMIPEVLSVKDPDIMCVCHSECCLNTMSLKASGGGNPAWKNWSAYVVDYDADACIKCGACAARCPMAAISFNEDGALIHDSTCVRCGQCVAVCPASARILRSRDEYPEVGPFPEKAEDYVEFAEYTLRDRINRGLVHDYTLTEIVG